MPMPLSSKIFPACGAPGGWLTGHRCPILSSPTALAKTSHLLDNDGRSQVTMARPALHFVSLCVLLQQAYAPWNAGETQKWLVLDVGFETARDYDITSVQPPQSEPCATPTFSSPRSRPLAPRCHGPLLFPTHCLRAPRRTLCEGGTRQRAR